MEQVCDDNTTDHLAPANAADKSKPNVSMTSQGLNSSIMGSSDDEAA
jgi:hypothetical protein